MRWSLAGNHVVVALAGALLALTSGVALMAFVKVVGIVFLGEARVAPVATAREAPVTLRAALVGLALWSVVIGVFAPWVVRLLGASGVPLVGLNVAGRVLQEQLIIQPAYPQYLQHRPLVPGVRPAAARACSAGRRPAGTLAGTGAAPTRPDVDIGERRRGAARRILGHRLLQSGARHLHQRLPHAARGR